MSSTRATICSVYGCEAPRGSRIAARIPASHFHDTFCMDVGDKTRSALGHFLELMRRVPAWVESMMQLRNCMVRLIGLDDLGQLGNIDSRKEEADYVAGDRISVFTLQANAPDEVIAARRDKHLEALAALVRLPIGADGKRRISLTSVVTVHSAQGALYMLPVWPMHKIIVRAVLARLGE